MAAETNPERLRLEEAKARTQAWRKWGPYVSERQWGTVREDYSADGDAWNYLPARACAQPRLSLGRGWHRRALRQQAASLPRPGALERQGPDPEGADVRPQQSRRAITARTSRSSTTTSMRRRPTATRACSTNIRRRNFPTSIWCEENARRTRQQPEFELIDTGIFDADRYFDVDIEYAKAATDDILMQVTVSNRGPEAAEIHVLPQLWFRNTWSWFDEERQAVPGAGRRTSWSITRSSASISSTSSAPTRSCSATTRPMSPKLFGVDESARILQGRLPRICGERQQGRRQHRHPGHEGGRHLSADRGRRASSEVIRVRLNAGQRQGGPFADFDSIFALRKSEADAFYGELQSKVDRRGSAPDPAPGLCRHALVQAVSSTTT